jgi:hypothetical protein
VLLPKAGIRIIQRSAGAGDSKGKIKYQKSKCKMTKQKTKSFVREI